MSDTLEMPAPVATASVVDLDHLDRFTMGDKDLQQEVLGLFRSHSVVQINQLQAAVGDATAWHAATHGLKGSARGIGAWALGDAAEAAEREVNGPEEAHREHLHRISQCLEATNTGIARLLAQ